MSMTLMTFVCEPCYSLMHLWYSESCCLITKKEMVGLWLEMQINYSRKMGHTTISYDQINCILALELLVSGI